MPHAIYSYQFSLAEDVAANDWKQFQTNVKKAAFNREKVTIGGGEFYGEALWDMVVFMDNCVMRQSLALNDMKKLVEKQQEEIQQLKEKLSETIPVDKF